MAVSPSDLTELDRLLSDPTLDGQALSVLRQSLPHLSFARCDAMDLDDRPQREYPRFDLHYLDNSDFCMKIVAGPDQATGVILARRSKLKVPE
jgi:hypothetical protein